MQNNIEKKFHHIPRHAQKVFEGVFFSIYHWQQKRFDGTMATYEHARKTDGVIIITEYKGTLVIEKQQQPGTPWYYCFPSGHIDAGETPRQAALRELKEETHLVTKDCKKWFSVKPYHKIDHTVHVFIAKDCLPAAEVAENPDRGGERIELLYWNLRKVLAAATETALQNSGTPVKKNVIPFSAGVLQPYLIAAHFSKIEYKRLSAKLFSS